MFLPINIPSPTPQTAAMVKAQASRYKLRLISNKMEWPKKDLASGLKSSYKTENISDGREIKAGFISFILETNSQISRKRMTGARKYRIDLRISLGFTGSTSYRVSPV